MTARRKGAGTCPAAAVGKVPCVRARQPGQPLCAVHMTAVRRGVVVRGPDGREWTKAGLRTAEEAAG